jgi:hypothetical protein
MLKKSQSQELQIVRTDLEFLEANLTSDKKFNIPACYLETLIIQPLEQTLIQKGGGLEVELMHHSHNSLPLW